jgi:hypothetical protein
MVFRATPNSSTNAVSGGSFDPTGHRPVEIASSIAAATMSTLRPESAMYVTSDKWVNDLIEVSVPDQVGQ